MAKAHIIMTEADMGTSSRHLVRAGYGLENDELHDMRSYERGDVILEVWEVDQYITETYSDLFGKDSANFVEAPRIHISGEARMAFDLHRKDLRDKPKQSITEIRARLRADLIKIRDQLRVGGHKSHLYTLAETLNDCSKIVYKAETID